VQALGARRVKTLDEVARWWDSFELKLESTSEPAGGASIPEWPRSAAKGDDNSAETRRDRKPWAVLSDGKWEANTVIPHGKATEELLLQYALINIMSGTR